MLYGSDAFLQHYSSWVAAQGLGSKLHAFVSGSSNMIEKISIPPKFIITLMGVFISSFAATTLDTATRLQRYIVSEGAVSFNNKFFAKKHPATLLAVISAAILAFYNGSGTGALTLWPLFGTLNQLLAGISLLVITIYLLKTKSNYLYSFVPMIFMLLMTFWAMKINLFNFYIQSNWLLLVIGIFVVILELWILVETLILLIKNKVF
jgi:carbon starvation protein